MQSLLDMCINVVIEKLLAHVTDDTTLGVQILAVYEERRRQLATSFVAAINQPRDYDFGHQSSIRISELQAARSFLRRTR
jgi:hypothetical protein